MESVDVAGLAHKDWMRPFVERAVRCDARKGASDNARSNGGMPLELYGRV
jgi:hypothetical protein